MTLQGFVFNHFLVFRRAANTPTHQHTNTPTHQHTNTPVAKTTW